MAYKAKTCTAAGVAMVLLAALVVIQGCSTRVDEKPRTTLITKKSEIEDVRSKPVPASDRREIYSEVVGFSSVQKSVLDKYYRPKPPLKPAYIFEDEIDWEKFKAVYFEDIPIPAVDFSKEKAVFIQAEWQEASGPPYEVESMKVSGGILDISVKPESATVSVAPVHRDSIFRYVLIIAVDSRALREGLTPVLNME